MRTAFVNGLIALAEADERVILLTGDLGFMVLEPFAARFPDRFFNVGAAEQNMMAMATGLAEAGFRPFVYSISPFVTLRPLEFLRNGPVFHKLPVRVVSVGGGFAYGFGGKSHHSLEDLAVLRPMRDLLLVAPADPAQAASALAATAEYPGPVFFRLDKNDRDSVPGLDGTFEIGRLKVVREGSDCSIIALGPVAVEACRAADLLTDTGISVTVAIVATFNPAPEKELLALPGPWVTVEEHVTVGGLGGWVAECAASAGYGHRVHRCGVEQSVFGLGSQQWYRSQHGLDAKGIADAVIRVMKR